VRVFFFWPDFRTRKARPCRLCQNSVLVGHDHKMQRMRFQPYAICGHDSEFRNSLPGAARHELFHGLHVVIDAELTPRNRRA